MPFANSTLFPITTGVSDDRLTLGGCAADDLAAEFGTPLYVFDEATLRQVCREFVGEFGSRYADSQVLYASKAFINPALARLVSEEGLGLDVVSGGELAVAQAAGIPPEDIYFHGNNKGPEELEMALDYGVGRIVVDNFDEMELLDGLARSRGVVQDVMLRLSPGVDPHTHVHTTTGTLDSKFGFAIETGDAEAAMRGRPEGRRPGPGRRPHAPGLTDIRARALRDRDRRGAHVRRLSRPRRLHDAGVQPWRRLRGRLSPGQPAASDRRLRRGDRLGGRASVRRSGPWLAQARGRAGPRHRRARRRRPLLRGKRQGHPGRPQVRVGGRRHGRQHSSCALRRGVRGGRRQPPCRTRPRRR